MHVTYTHLDNSVTTFTANTAIYGDVRLGNSITPADNVRYKILANTSGSGITAKPVVNVQGDHMFEYVEHGQIGFVKDYGLSTWAIERLTAEEQTVFFTQAANWNDSKDNTTDANFIEWWNRFTADPHVTVSNT